MKKTGVLLVNLGTPDSPKFFDVARYLIEFLTDKRVIDRPWLFRQFLVRLVIVPSRCRQSAQFYQKIWTPEGSPLKVYGHRIESKLQDLLGDDFCVALGMRYQNPSIQQALENLRQQSIQRLVVIPLFPQYASATTGSVQERVMQILSTWDLIPELHMVSHYETQSSMIQSFCESAKPFDLSNYDHVLFSFHGLPQNQLRKVDCSGTCFTKDCCLSLNEKNHSCYSAQCYATAEAIVKSLKLTSDQYSVSFQSRLGKEPWLEPYTNEVIHSLAARGVKRLLVFCPSFVCDCLETLHEIGVEYAEEFKQAGGEHLDLVPGLNENESWILALKEIVYEQLGFA